jgi:hypothetical protein
MNDISNKGNPRRNGPRLVRMDIAMKSLTDADQTAWDSVSEEGKGIRLQRQTCYQQ